MSSPKPKFKTACRVCRERKVKCDREQPCHNCNAASTTCTYPPQVRTVRRPKRAAVAKKDSSAEDVSLVSRLNRLESFLKKHAPNFELVDGDDDVTRSDINNWIQMADIGDDVSQDQAPTSCSTTSGPSPATDRGLAHEASRRANPSFADPALSTAQEDAMAKPGYPTGDLNDSNYWSQLAEAGAHNDLSTASRSPILQNPNVIPSLSQLAQGIASKPTGFPLRQQYAKESPRLLPTRHRAFCWRKYTENVDPLVKIIHKPSTRELMLVQLQDGQKLHPASLALIQAICLISLTSMSDDDVMTNIQCDKETLTRTCSALTEQALMAANFLDARDMRILQAFLLFLYYLKYMNDSRLRALCGVAVYLSLRIGLNRDPGSSSLPSLDIELRRRLWWQLITFVDHPDDSGLDCFPHPLTVGADTRIPLNIDDDDLENGIIHAVSDRSGFTETSFSLIQYEITQSFNQTLLERGAMNTTFTKTVHAAEQRLRHSEENLKAKYFRKLTSRQAFEDFAAKTSAMMLTKRCFPSYLFPGNTSQSTAFGDEEAEGRVFRLGVQVLDLSRKIQRAKAFEKWRWLHGTFFQWTAANFIVKQLPCRAQDSAARKAWLLIDGIFDYWPESVQCGERAASLRRSITEARRRRDALAMYNTTPSPSIRLDADFTQLESQLDEHLLERRRRNNESLENLLPELELPMLPPVSLNALFTEDNFDRENFNGDMLDWDFLPVL